MGPDLVVTPLVALTSTSESFHQEVETLCRSRNQAGEFGHQIRIPHRVGVHLVIFRVRFRESCMHNIFAVLSCEVFAEGPRAVQF